MELTERVHERERFLRAAAIAVVATGVFAAWVGWSIGGETSALYVDDLATVLAGLSAAVLCLRAGMRYAAEQRAFWWLLAAACGAWTVGEVIWGIYDLVLRESVPVPSWADVGYLTGIPLAVVALVCHPALRGSGTEKARSVLDALTVATALLFLSWTVVLGPLWRSADMSTLGGLVAFAYPFGDVVIIFFIVLAIRGMTAGYRLALWCMLAGLLALALSDATYSYLTEVKSYESGNLIDTGWFAGYLGIALGAYSTDRSAVASYRTASAPPALASLVAPFVPVIGALGFAAIKLELGERLDDVAWIAAFALIALVLARQGLLAFDMLARSEEREVVVAKQLAHAALGRPGPTATEAGVTALTSEKPGDGSL